MNLKFEEKIKPHIKYAKNGDINSLKIILKETEKEIYSILYCLCKDKEIIQDIIQEVLLKIATKIKTLKNEDSYVSWMNKIVLREYYNHQRINKKYKNNELIENYFQEEKIDKKQQEPLKNCIGNEVIKEIIENLKKLQEPYKIAIIMREFEGLSYDEIAKLTNTNIGTVKSRISRARSQLKERLSKALE